MVCLVLFRELCDRTFQTQLTIATKNLSNCSCLYVHTEYEDEVEIGKDDDDEEDEEEEEVEEITMEYEEEDDGQCIMYLQHYS